MRHSRLVHGNPFYKPAFSFHRDYKLSGKTSVWMFPIYGMASILTPLFEMLRGKSVMLRGSIYACLIFLGEFCSGSLLKKYDLCPWDYSNARWNICGLIRLDYAPLWFGAGLFFERLLSKSERSH